MEDSFGWYIIGEEDQLLAGPFTTEVDAVGEMMDPLNDGNGEPVTPDYYFQWGIPRVKYGEANWEVGKLNG